MDLPALTDLIDLSGKRALVTGGSKGIGAACAQRLVEAGAHVTVADLDPAGAEAAAAMGAEFVVCDITDPTQLEAAVDTAAGNDGLDILVNNAGIYPTTGPVAKVTDEFIDRMLDVNVRAQFSATREAAARMPKGGAIVNMASIAAIGGGANISAYSASKGGVVGLTLPVARDLSAVGIRVNCIAPGLIRTEFSRALWENEKILREATTGSALRRIGEPDEMAGAAVYFASPASSFTTGQTLVMDGGQLV